MEAENTVRLHDCYSENLFKVTCILVYFISSQKRPVNAQKGEATVILGTSHQKCPSVLINTTCQNYMNKHFINTLHLVRVAKKNNKKSSPLSLLIGHAKILAWHLNSPAIYSVKLLIYIKN